MNLTLLWDIKSVARIESIKDEDEDIRDAPRRRLPYTNPTNAATTSKLPQQPTAGLTHTFSALPHVSEDSEPVERPDENITALPERQPRCKFSSYFRSRTPTPATQPTVAKVETKCSEAAPTAAPATNEVEPPTRPACRKAKWGAFFKSPLRGIKLSKGRKEEVEKPRLNISAPHGFRHEESGNWPQAVHYRSDGEEDDEYEDDEDDHDDEEEGYESEWEDVEE
ncbi:hypothetical protein BCR34DRAFT_614961 [Clohesyomyces aquaticus]|uniref:Uncharacterized protein n=1 Tax=Clohesyomyces aquaticus TaxID=1231657 RepID=A0A1Y1ZLJ1_9PLEO|nr:hypothetical protein BCR34DRAFT_614961 [Clohesyomyces aquaticus]